MNQPTLHTSEVYDFRQYDRIWQRVAPNLEPYPGAEQTAGAAAVQAAVDKYIAWQCGKLGRDINPSKLISLLMQTGVKRVDLTSPVFTHLQDGNQTLNADMSYDPAEAVPQVARVMHVTIHNGGYEDE